MFISKLFLPGKNSYVLKVVSLVESDKTGENVSKLFSTIPRD